MIDRRKTSCHLIFSYQVLNGFWYVSISHFMILSDRDVWSDIIWQLISWGCLCYCVNSVLKSHEVNEWFLFNTTCSIYFKYDQNELTFEKMVIMSNMFSNTSNNNPCIAPPGKFPFDSNPTSLLLLHNPACLAEDLQIPI